MYKLESAAVVEVQMKRRSHWKLLCKFRWQFTREIADQGEQYRWMYRAQRGAEEARESCTGGCTGKRRSRGRGELHRRLYKSQRGAQEARESRTYVCTEHTKAPNRCPRGFKLGPRSVQDSQVEPKRHPRGSELSPRGAQEAPS